MHGGRGIVHQRAVTTTTRTEKVTTGQEPWEAPLHAENRKQNGFPRTDNGSMQEARNDMHRKNAASLV